MALVRDLHYSNQLMSGFTKLFSSLVYSTVWREDMHVKVVWITMLALADRNGRVLASVPGLADAARVTLEQCQDALKRLSSPDEWSRTKAHDGKRIQDTDGGWQLLNYLKYRELRDGDERRIQNRHAVRRHRGKGLVSVVTNVSNVSHGKPMSAQAEAEAEAEAEADQDQTPLFIRFWNCYPKKVGKGKASREFAKLRPSEALLTAMIKALSWQVNTPQWAKDGGKFIPHPATWLHQHRWEDEPFNPPDPTDQAWKDFHSRLSRE